MSNKIKDVIVCFIFAFLFSSCSSQNDNPLGGPCTYTSTSGTATIVSLNSAPNTSLNCNNNPVVVVFNFTSSNPADANASTDNNQVLTVGEGYNPPLAYVLGKGLTIGSTHPCIRMNETSGTCVPVVFKFTDVDLSDYATSCF